MQSINSNPTLFFEVVLETGQIKAHHDSLFVGVPNFSEVISSSSVAVNTHIREITRDEITGYDEEGNPIIEPVTIQNTYYTYSPAFLDLNSDEVKAAVISKLQSELKVLTSDLSSNYFHEVTIGGATKATFLSTYSAKLAEAADLQAQITSVSGGSSNSSSQA